MNLATIELHDFICPACSEQVEAVARDGQIKGYCAIAQQYVDIPIEIKLDKKNYRDDPEYRAKLREASRRMWQDPEYRAKQKAALKDKVAK
jgi:hypothetical protein